MSLELEESFYETERARLERWVPWVHLFRGFRLATRWQNLVLALLGVLLLTGGRALLTWTPFAQSDGAYSAVQGWNESQRLVGPWERSFLSPPLPSVREVSFLSAVLAPGETWDQAVRSGRTVLSPQGDLLGPALALLAHRPTWGQLADVWLHVLLVLSIGALIGGAITRRVAVEFAGKGEPGLIESLRFSISHFPFVIGAPFIAAVGVGMLWGMGRILAWLGRIPGIDEAIMAFFWGLLLVLSLVMSLILLGLAAGWPLMVSAHSTEGTDGFDALNRAFNYVFVRPWYALWLLVVTIVYGGLLICFVVSLTGLVVTLAEWTAAGPISDEGLARITYSAPDLVRFQPPMRESSSTSSTPLGAFWYGGLASLLTAFVYSFFWTAATIIYFLLRRSVDACGLDHVYLPPPPRPAGPPLVGVPSAERREAEATKAETQPPSGDTSGESGEGA